jgi:phosphate transport system protein
LKASVEQEVQLMPNPRQHFQDQLLALQTSVEELGAVAIRQVGAALDGVTVPADHEAIIAGDDEADERYIEVERDGLHLIALQGPVASDLRLLTGLLHVGLHLERIADGAVNIAKLTRMVAGLPPDPAVQRQLSQMGNIVLPMLGTAMDALARRDLELAKQLQTMDEPIDRLNRGVVDRLMSGTVDQRALGWAVPMCVAAREIERIGDHAVDIGEQIAFIVTGELVEFTDAS